MGRLTHHAQAAFMREKVFKSQGSSGGLIALPRTHHTSAFIHQTSAGLIAVTEVVVISASGVVTASGVVVSATGWRSRRGCL